MHSVLLSYISHKHKISTLSNSTGSARATGDNSDGGGKGGGVTMATNQPPRLTQPGHPFVGRRNEYQPKCGDALQLGSKGGYGCMWVAGKTVIPSLHTAHI